MDNLDFKQWFAAQKIEDQIEMKESLAALTEEAGINVDDLRKELGL